MTKSIFYILILTLTIGCSETNVYESGDEDAGSSGESSTSSNTGGSDTSTGGTGGSSTGSTGGSSGTSASDIFYESCDEAGAVITASISASLTPHSAYSTANNPLIDSSGNQLTCSCPVGFTGGASLWVPGLEKNNGTIGDSLGFAAPIKDRFSVEGYPNLCGEGCVDVRNVLPNSACEATGSQLVLCAATMKAGEWPTNCSVVEDNASNNKASLLCCSNSSYSRITSLN